MLVKKRKITSFMRWFFQKPARVIVSSFLFVDFVGTLLLMLPISSQDGRSLGFINSLFTTVSATCVTGLVVVDTATHFTIFGRVVVICLIQIGGLGLVTITTFFLSLVRRRVGLRARVLAQESSGSFSFMELPQLVKSIVLTTLAFEFTGFVLLSTQYVPQFGWSGGLGRASFQAVSAFCNAGFDLMGDTASGPYSSLTAYSGNPVVLLTTGFLIIFGGLGFIVWRDLFNYRKTKSLRLHSKIAISMTVCLVVAGSLFFLFAEWNNKGVQAMGSLPEWQRPLAAFFQSVTLRTAGFNSINQANLLSGSKLISVMLMFIGAGSGSTGGGIKVTTFALLLAAVASDIRGRDQIVIRNHQIPRVAVQRAIAIFFLGMGVMVGLSFILCFTEAAALHKGTFEYLDLLFESASAFGTVGVTSAQTPVLTTLSHIFIIPAMFIGRVGPVTFAISLAMHESKEMINIYPEGKVQIG
ncbi:MAG: potassium transporter TrkG [Eubacteriales bacterium]